MVFLGIYRAVYDYQAQSEEELDIKDGDLLFLLEKSGDDDWWRCKKKAASEDDEEPEGLVPNNYVEEAKPIHQARALYDYTKQTDEELSFKDETRLDVYDASDPDWTLVGSNGEFGFAPAIYIESAPAASSAQPTRSLASAPPPMPTRPRVDDAPIPGEADYSPPSPGPAAHNPAAQLAGIIAQKTGGAQPSAPVERSLASPPLPQRPQYTPEESEEEEAPSLPRRPASQSSPVAAPLPKVQFASPRNAEPSGGLPSPPHSRAPINGDVDEPRSPSGYHLYNISEMVEHMGRSRKMPTTLGINLGRGTIMISPEKSRDGPSKEWTAEKLTHYSIEGKHVFVELVRPSKSVDFHAGSKDTAQEIVAALGELAGAVRQEGLREVIAASAGTGAAGQKKGKMLYEFMAQGDDEVTVAADDEVIVLDDKRSEEWWMVRRIKNGKEGVVPSSYVEITGTIPYAPDSITGLNAARSTVEQNRLEEERLAREAVQKDKRREPEVGPGVALPERGSSLASDSRHASSRGADKKDSSRPKTKPNQDRIRTWTDRSGTFKVEAEFIGLREGKIHLHKMNGVKIAVPVGKMAVEDLEYVERATGASLDEDKPLSDIKRRSTQKAKEKERQSSSRPTAGATIQKKDEYDWFDFFLQCGVNPQICERYAGAFSRDQMGPEVLPEVNEQLLRTLGLKEGDILRVMKFLDNKYDRKSKVVASASAGSDDAASSSAGGLFSGPGGALRNNTRKGRPAPTVQTTDVVDENAFKTKTDSPAADEPAKAAPVNQPSGGQVRQGRFDDDAWDVKPSRTGNTNNNATAAPTPAPAPPQPTVNDDIASLAITAPALQPTPTAQPAPPPAPAAQTALQPPTAQQQASQPQGANQAIFDKIASLAPAAQQQQPQQTGFQPQGFQPMQTGYQPPQPLAPQQTALPRQRPAPPPQQSTGGVLNMPPPPRSASAPGYPQQQQSSFGPAPLQPQMTGYPVQGSFPQLAPSGQSLADLQNQQRFQQLQPQQTAFQPQAGFGGGFQQPNGIAQQNGVQSIQQNYPALQPQPTGFQPQSQFGQQQAQQFGLAQPGYQQQIVNGAQTGSPFSTLR